MMSIWNSIDPPSIDKITDKLYISNERGAGERKILDDRKITHILVAGNFLQKKFPNDFKYLQLPLNDFPSQDLTPFFHDAVKFIDEADRVLVHCAAGISRSSSMVIAYLMIKNKTSYKDTYSMVKGKRPIICPNKGFVAQLMQLEKFLIENGDTDFGSISNQSEAYRYIAHAAKFKVV